MTAAQFAVEKAMAELSTSEDREDQAFCAAMASVLHAWQVGQAQRFLVRIRICENYDRHITDLPSSAILN